MTNFKEDILQITTRLIVEEGFNYAEAKQKAADLEGICEELMTLAEKHKQEKQQWQQQQQQ